MSEIAATINEFRTRHLSELTEVINAVSFYVFFLLLKFQSSAQFISVEFKTPFSLK
jgi:hypothetical protein